MSGRGLDAPQVWYVSPEQVDVLAEILALHRAHKQTLGFLPAGAFVAFAADARLLVATASGGTVVGYAAFDRSLNRIRLVHLCVSQIARKGGVARLLVDRISDDHPRYGGIVARCRADFEASHVWGRLGFVPLGEKPGRGKMPSRIVVWWRSHGIPDLFSGQLEDERVLTVALDHNVFIDLKVNRDRHGAEESQALESDWLAELIRLVVTGETFAEIQRLPSEGDRERQRAAASGFQRLEHTRHDFQTAESLLEAALGVVDDSERSDFLHVVSAAAGGVTVFVTRDSRWIARVADAAWAALKVKVLRPSDVVAHLDALQDQDSYRPAALRGTSYVVQDSAAVSDLSPLLNTAAGELRAPYRTMTRSMASDPRLTRREVRDLNGAVVAAWAFASVSRVLQVTFLRTAYGSISSTIARQIVFQLRMDARARELNTIEVADPHPSRAVTAAMTSDGFVQKDGHWWAATLSASGSSAALAELLDEGHPCRPLGAALAQAGLDDGSQSVLERALWPAKALDGPLRNYIIPIKPGWARELFSLGDTLWARDPLLGLSREHVYYRSPRLSPRAPARILWYASGTGRDRIGGVVACSYLDRVTTGAPAQLHDRFRHLGVWQLENIQSVARNGVAEALRFLDTENFARLVPFELITELTRNRPIGSIQSPTSIDSGLFGALYWEGTRADAS